jgi:DNA-binding NarL/FixJ family response regulator
MVAIAIFSADPAMRQSLEQLLREHSTFSIVGVAGDPAAISLLIDHNHVNVVLADAPPCEQLADWRLRHNQTAFVIFVNGADQEDGLDALHAGARAILPRTAKRDEIVTAIKAATKGLAVLPSELLPTLLSGASLVGELLDDDDAHPASSKYLPRWQTASPTKPSHVGWESPSTPPSFMSPPFSPSSMRTVGPKRWLGLHSSVS